MSSAVSQSKLMKMYHTKSSKSSKSSKKSKRNKQKKKKNQKNAYKQKAPSVTPSTASTLSPPLSKELEEYFFMTRQKNSLILNLPIVLLELVFYEYFYPWKRYKLARVCKLFRFIVDDTLQSVLNDSKNDNRIHNFKVNAIYFNKYFLEFVKEIQNSNKLMIDFSNEGLKLFNNEQKQYLSYIFMYQSKLSSLYQNILLNDNNNNSEISSIKEDFYRILNSSTKLMCGNNEIWFNVGGMDIISPILQSKYSLISTLLLDRNYINDKIIFQFCQSLLIRNIIYNPLSKYYHCTFLKRINLSQNNNITDIGLNTLFAVIGEKLPNLQEIYLNKLKITNLSCKVIYKYYQLFGANTRLRAVLLTQNKFIDKDGISVLNDLYKNNIIEIGDNVRFYVAGCRFDANDIYNNSWDDRIIFDINRNNRT